MVCIIYQNGVRYWCILHILWKARWNRERKNVSLWTILRNWGNRTISAETFWRRKKTLHLRVGFLIEVVVQSLCRGKLWEEASSHLTSIFAFIFWSHMGLGRWERPAPYWSVCWGPQEYYFPGHEPTWLSIGWTNCCYKHVDSKMQRRLSRRKW